MFHELLSRGREDGRATGQPQGVGPGGAGLCARLKSSKAGTEAGPADPGPGDLPEDARKDGHIRGRSNDIMTVNDSAA